MTGGYCGKPASFVVRNVEGLETFACDEHAERPQWVILAPFSDWFQARGLPAPAPADRPCTDFLERGDA